MSVKPVFSGTVSGDRIPEPALGIAELGAANLSEANGKIYVGVVFRISYLNGQIAACQLKILVSRDILN